MSTTANIPNEFLTLKYVVAQKGNLDSNTIDRITTMIKDANRKVILSLIPIRDDIVLNGTVFFDDARDIAMLYFDSEYERKILKLTEEPKITFTKYKESRDLLVAAIKAQPEDAKRTKPATASCSYSSSLLESIPEITDKNQSIIPR